MFISITRVESHQSDLPNESWSETSHKSSNSLGSPDGSHAVPCIVVLTSCGHCESVRLHSRLDHVYRVYHCPELNIIRSYEKQRCRDILPHNQRSHRIALHSKDLFDFSLYPLTTFHVARVSRMRGSTRRSLLIREAT